MKSVQNVNGLNLVETVTQDQKEHAIFDLLVKIGNTTNNNAILLFVDFINYGIGQVTSLDEMQLLHDKMLLSIKTCDTMSTVAKQSARGALGNNLKAIQGYCYMRANHPEEFGKVEAINNSAPRKWYNAMIAKKNLLSGATPAKTLAISAADAAKQVDHLTREIAQDRAAIIETLLALANDKSATLSMYKSTVNSLITKLKQGREALPLYQATKPAQLQAQAS